MPSPRFLMISHKSGEMNPSEFSSHVKFKFSNIFKADLKLKSVETSVKSCQKSLKSNLVRF